MKKLFVGIDFSKEKVDAAIIIADGLNEIAPRAYNEFKTTNSGYNQLIKWVSKHSEGIDEASWLFCGEHTGDYSIGLCDYVYGKGLDFWLENAVNIKDASGIRRLKSDRADANMIAEYAMRNYDKAVMYEPLSDSLKQLREYFLGRHQLVCQKASCTVRMNEKEFTTNKSQAICCISEITQNVINEINKGIEILDAKIKELIDSDEELSRIYDIVTSIPGIGTQNAVCLMVYTNNFKKFNYDARKIACYYGIAPFGRDSGTSVHSAPHVHYMANKLIKSMLTQAALISVRYCPILTSYYQRLLGRGKKMMVALNNVKNKLIHIVTAMVRNGQKYDSAYRNPFFVTQN